MRSCLGSDRWCSAAEREPCWRSIVSEARPRCRVPVAVRLSAHRERLGEAFGVGAGRLGGGQGPELGALRILQDRRSKEAPARRPGESRSRLLGEKCGLSSSASSPMGMSNIPEMASSLPANKVVGLIPADFLKSGVRRYPLRAKGHARDVALGDVEEAT